MDNTLNDIKLNGNMMASLFGHSIVSFPTVKYIGKNRKHILVFVKSPKHDFVAEKELSFLNQILTACRLDMDDIAMVNLASQPIMMENVVHELKPLYILSFGTGSGTELFRMENREGIRYLNAPGLGEMMNNTDQSRQLKGKLWAELKSLFAIS